MGQTKNFRELSSFTFLVKRIKLMLPSLSNNECRNNKTVKYQNVAIAKYQNHIKFNVRCQIWINTNER